MASDGLGRRPGTAAADVKLPRGSLLRICTPAGGGYGDARERDSGAIEREDFPYVNAGDRLMAARGNVMGERVMTMVGNRAIAEAVAMTASRTAMVASNALVRLRSRSSAIHDDSRRCLSGWKAARCWRTMQP